MSDKPTIGIMGMGVVGKAAAAYYKGQGHEVLPYDKATDDKQALRRLNDKADVVLVCVGTPAGCPGLYMGDVCEAVASTAKPGRTIIIHSTLMPGTTDALQKEYPEARIVYVPEFLSEATAEEDYARPHRSLVAGSPTGRWQDPDTMCFLPGDMPPSHLPAHQAELLKLATNAFYAFKVTFANMLFDAGMTSTARDVLGYDPRIGDSHFDLFHKGYRGFGGKCLPKDTRALAAYARQFERGKPLAEMLEKMLEYNAGLGVGR